MRAGGSIRKLVEKEVKLVRVRARAPESAAKVEVEVEGKSKALKASVCVATKILSTAAGTRFSASGGFIWPELEFVRD